ncbi:MAG: hypothetical protein ACFE9R_21640 [Candidatus Hermodarchaeota archaeon]
MERKNLAVKVVLKVVKSIFIVIYLTLIVGLIAGGISAGILTMLPDEASKPCYLGYYAHCAFTPYSTLILFAMAIVGTILLIKLVKYFKRQYKNLTKAKPILQALINK